jgi:hypothetical protein
VSFQPAVFGPSRPTLHPLSTKPGTHAPERSQVAGATHSLVDVQVARQLRSPSHL